jgi:hypothetical protein
MKKQFLIISIFIAILGFGYIFSCRNIRKNDLQITKDVINSCVKKKENTHCLTLLKDINQDFSIIENMYMVVSKMNYDYLVERNITPLFSKSEDWLHERFSEEAFDYTRFDEEIRFYSDEDVTFMENFHISSYGIIAKKVYSDGEILLRFNNYYDDKDEDYIICNMIVQKNTKLFIYSYFTKGCIILTNPTQEEKKEIDNRINIFYNSLQL